MLYEGINPSCLCALCMHLQWLHPDKFKTKMCTDGQDCKRKVC